MPRKTGLTFAIVLGALLFVSLTEANEFFNLPVLPPPEGYGTLQINRTSTKKGMAPVIFSHWQHRIRFTCRVCHGELDFAMQVNSTEITEYGNRKGRFCGACHNGKIAFKANGNCTRCHVENVKGLSKKFNETLTEHQLTHTEFGNCIDWVEALRRGKIAPRTFLKQKSEDMPFDKMLLLEADWSMIPPSIFPHKTHTEWLDCSNCHPEIFNIKKKTTKHFSMAYILRGQFCGVCHLSIAFPMNDCARCHPKKQDLP